MGKQKVLTNKNLFEYIYTIEYYELKEESIGTGNLSSGV